MVKQISQQNGGLEGLLKRLEDLKGDWAKVGWFPGARYPARKDKKGKPIAGTDIPVAQVAIIQEYGDADKGIPPRSFMRAGINENRSQIRKLIGDGAKGILKGTESSYTVANGVGLKVSGIIRAKITKIKDPPLKQATIDARSRRYANRKKAASDKPLVDTRLMISSLTYTTSIKSS